MKLKVKDEIKGENVGLISTNWPNGQLGPLTRALIGGAQPKKRLVGPRHATPFRGGGD